MPRVTKKDMVVGQKFLTKCQVDINPHEWLFGKTTSVGPMTTLTVANKPKKFDGINLVEVQFGDSIRGTRSGFCYVIDICNKTIKV